MAFSNYFLLRNGKAFFEYFDFIAPKISSTFCYETFGFKPVDGLVFF
jgi:hypothetical protein